MTEPAVEDVDTFYLQALDVIAYEDPEFAEEIRNDQGLQQEIYADAHAFLSQ